MSCGANLQVCEPVVEPACGWAREVHLPTGRLQKSLKGFTAREANKILGQRESYDHWVRNEKEFQRIVSCIENNPVTAGLAARAEDYRWSLAYKPA